MISDRSYVLILTQCGRIVVWHTCSLNAERNPVRFAKTPGPMRKIKCIESKIYMLDEVGKVWILEADWKSFCMFELPHRTLWMNYITVSRHAYVSISDKIFSPRYYLANRILVSDPVCNSNQLMILDKIAVCRKLDDDKSYLILTVTGKLYTYDWSMNKKTFIADNAKNIFTRMRFTTTDDKLCQWDGTAVKLIF